MKNWQVLLLIIIWQIVFVVISGFAFNLLPLQKTFAGGGSRLYLENPWLYSRGNFDGLHYIYIATRGYGYAEQAFFPLYPNLIQLINKIIPNAYLSGVLISLVSFSLAMLFFQKLLRLDYADNKVFWMILALLVFPTSFYFGTVYTESLFLLFVIGAFYFARTRRWVAAAILAAWATNTRFVGIFMFPALLLEWWIQNRTLRSTYRNFLGLASLFIVPLGLLSYMIYLQIHYQDPLAFIHSLSSFGSYRSTSVIMLYQVFWRYAKMILSVQRGTLLYSSIIYEAATGLLFLALSIVALAKLRWSYALFLIATYLTPTLTGSFVSLPRYVLICFPGFILLGNILAKYPVIRNLYLLVCGLAFIILSALFVRGYWVA